MFRRYFWTILEAIEEEQHKLWRRVYLDVEDLDHPVGAAGRQTDTIEVHLGVVDHVLEDDIYIPNWEKYKRVVWVVWMSSLLINVVPDKYICRRFCQVNIYMSSLMSGINVVVPEKLKCKRLRKVYMSWFVVVPEKCKCRRVYSFNVVVSIKFKCRRFYKV